MAVADNTGGGKSPPHLPKAEERQAIDDDVRIHLPDSPTTRRRRRQSSSALGLSSSARGSGGGGGTAFHYTDDSDSEGENHGGKSKNMFERSCPIGQFFLNPCLFLTVRARMCRALLSRAIGPQRGGKRELRRRGGRQFDVDVGRTMAMAVAASLTVVILIRWTLSGRGWRRRGEYPPVLIPAFDYSQSGDIGGWMTPYEFPRLASLEPMHPEGWATNADDDRFEEEKEEKEEENEGSSESKIEHVKDDRDPNSFRMPGYGGIKFQSLEGADETSFQRVIDMDAEAAYWRNLGKHVNDPHISHTYAFDDDYRLDPVCRRNSWWGLYKPNCNAFHEIDLQRKFEKDVITVTEDHTMDSHYISHGYYRDVWLVENHSHESTEAEGLALKLLRWKHKFNYKQIETVRKDAIVMERLTGSPRIIDMYGHCAFSVTVEALDEEVEEFVVPGSGYAKQKDLNDSDDVDVKNKFTVTEKLEMALAMAESIADLHGFKDGIIVHDDIQLCQWLRTKSGVLKLGDFNRAEVMLWDEDKQEYCKYNNGPGFGNYRAPEEFAAEDLNEQIDVFSMGNNIYGLLTGLWVFYENEDDEVVQGKIIDGETAFIDDRYRTRSYAEGRLVEIMERCWKKDPDKRATIFDVVAFLRETLKEHNKREGKK